MYRDEFLSIGGHDSILRSCREDSDVFNRMKLDGFKFIQSWSSLVYHLTGRGAGSFEGDEKRHEQWKKEMDNSTKDFIRKWGTSVQHTAMMDPIVSPKYDIGYLIKNCNPQLIPTLELFASTIYVDCPYQDYINAEQPNTRFDLSNRIKNINDPKTNQILIEFDASQLNQNNFQLLQQLPQIIAESGGLGTFELDIFKLDVFNMDRLEKHLIENNNPYYQSQLLN
jgi:hypothetical protein